MRERTDTILLAFSCGKDAIGAWLECRKHFPRIVPYYMYFVPGLQFVEDSIRYYEDFFGCHIHRIPHPSFYRLINNFVFQPPQRRPIIEAAELPDSTFLDMQNELRESLGLGKECFVASGVRAADSPQRRVTIKKYGPISEKAGQFLPIWDWNKDRLVSEIRAAGVKLPIDYKIFGRSFDGIDYRFLEPMRVHLPDDYRRVLDWFPLADVELKRREYAATV